MANIEELKKIAEEKGVELTDDMLEVVAGGMSKEDWDKLTPEEQKQAQVQSIIEYAQTGKCSL